MIRVLLRLLLAGFFIVGLQACSSTEENKLVGEWAGADGDGWPLLISFTREREVLLDRGYGVLTGEWSATACRQPLELDLYLWISAEHTAMIPMIARFTEAGNLQLRTSKELKFRPTGFTDGPSSNQFILERKRNR